MHSTWKLIRHSGFILRSALLLCTAAALATLWTWQTSPATVDRLDSAIFEAYSDRYAGPYNEARALMEASDTEGAERILNELLEDMGTVHRWSRLARVYSATVEALIEISEERGDAERSVELSRRLVELDPNDYRYWLDHARHLNGLGDRNKAVDALFRAHRIAPHLLDTAAPLTGLLLEADRPEEAAEVVDGYLGANRGGTVALLHFPGGRGGAPTPLSELRSVSFNTGARRFVLPVGEEGAGGVSTLLVGFEHLRDAEIRVRSIRFLTPGGRMVETRPAFLRFGGVDVAARGGGVFTVTGPSPAVYFDLPPAIAGRELEAVEMVVEFRPLLPGDLSRLATEVRTP